MSELLTLLRDNYTRHYAKGNRGLDPRKFIPEDHKSLDLMFGNFLNALAPGEKVLDLGCGTGFFLYYLRRYRHLDVEGVDIAEPQVAIAREALPDLPIYCADASRFLIKRPQEYEAVFCFDVLEHISTEDELFTLLKIIWASLKPGGMLVCRVPNAANLTASYARYLDMTHFRLFTFKTLSTLLELAGFDDVSVVSQQSSSAFGKSRLAMEKLLHQFLFILCGHPLEKVFTKNLILKTCKQERGD